MRLPPGLVAITPGTLDARAAERFAGAVERAVGAGLCGVLVREPELSERDTLALAGRVRDVLDRVAPGRGWLALHDRLHLAPACGADAVHLGFRSLPLDEARAVLPRLVRDRSEGGSPGGLALGFSAHAHDEPGAWEQADYLAFGPVLDTPSKAGRLAPTGFDGLAAAVLRAGPKPLLALGGLLPEHAASVRATGAHGLLVLRGVFGAADPAQATRRYLAAWSEAERRGAVS